MRLLLALLILAVPPAAAACDLAGAPGRSLKTSRHEIVYRADPIRVGQHFSVDFAVCPVPESVRVDASMPAHRHGMNYTPSIVALGEGRYRAEGLMFHMPGHWELLFEVRANGTLERAAQGIDVE